jgi:hypothetical protein
MSDALLESRCPHCGTVTEVDREVADVLPVPLSLTEFETLIRNEWRKRLGPEAYARAHGTDLIRTLTLLTHASSGEGPGASLGEAVERLVADLRVEGAGRGKVRHELAVLAHSMRRVLRDAGAEPSVAEAFVKPVRSALEAVLDFPAPVKSSVGFELPPR